MAYVLRKIQTLRVNNSKILTIKNAKFSGYYFYLNSNIWWDFLPLTLAQKKLNIKVQFFYYIQLPLNWSRFKTTSKRPIQEFYDATTELSVTSVLNNFINIWVSHNPVLIKKSIPNLCV